MCAALVLDLADDCGDVCHHYHNLVDDQGKEVLKCEVNRQQFQIVNVQGPLPRGPCAGSLVRRRVSPPSLDRSVSEELKLREGGCRGTPCSKLRGELHHCRVERPSCGVSTGVKGWPDDWSQLSLRVN